MYKELMLAVLVFFPFLAGIITWIIGRRNKILRDYVAIAFGIMECVTVLCVFALYGSFTEGHAFIHLNIPYFCGMGLAFEMDGFRAVYTSIAGFMWMMTLMLSKEYFSHHHHRNRYYFFMLWTLGATMGVFLSASLYTTFIFFEIMSFTSYVWVAQEENVPSLRAAETYLAVAVIGGLVMLMGIFLIYEELGTVMFDKLPSALTLYGKSPKIYVAGICMLFGFGAKAGAFPLHIWLPKAHPVAPAPASALLSGILTKTGIYGILVISSRLFLHDAAWGNLILVIGEITMFGGALLAVFSVDLKRTLACSSMSQIGFILVGVGMQGLLGEENLLAVHGTLLHMVNHSLIKLVLFMAAGVIYMNAHSLNLNEIRGFGRNKPILKLAFLTGALSIAGIPIFSGYVSKTLLHEAIVEYGGGFAMKAAEWVFLLSGGMTLAYMTKLFVAIFVEKNENPIRQKNYDTMKHYMMNLSSTFAIAGSAFILFIWGILPHVTMDRVAHLGQIFMRNEEAEELVHYFSLKNLSGAMISITIGIVLYVFFIRRFLRKKEGEIYHYVNVWPAWLDLENLLYRPLILSILPVMFGVFFRVFDTLPDTFVVLMRKTLYKDSPLPREREEGTILSTMIGRIRNGIQKLANLSWNRKNPTRRDYVHLEALKSEERGENYKVIQRSLSFGLLLFGVGLLMMLVYLVFF